MNNFKADRAEQVFRIVDNVLKQVVGEKATLLIYKYLESRFSLRTDEFSIKLEVLTEGLRSLLCAGGSMVERKILSALCSIYGLFGSLEITKTEENEYIFASQARLIIQNIKQLS